MATVFKMSSFSSSCTLFCIQLNVLLLGDVNSISIFLISFYVLTEPYDISLSLMATDHLSFTVLIMC